MNQVSQDKDTLGMSVDPTRSDTRFFPQVEHDLTRKSGSSELKRNYTVLREIKKTLYGSVLLAHRKSDGERVAIKSFVRGTKNFDNGLTSLDNVQTEASMLTFLRDKMKGVVQLIDYFQDSKGDYLVLEYANHGDMLDFLQRHPRFIGEKPARKIFKKIITIVADLHKLRVAHMDLSLENFLICQDRSLTLCDFGVAVSEDTVMPTQARVGKPMYMAPELITHSQNSTPGMFDPFKADMYSLGIILFCLIYGFQPYRDPDKSDPVFKAIAEHSDFREALSIMSLSGEATQEAEDLLSHLICHESTRITIDQVITHPWTTLSSS